MLTPPMASLLGAPRSASASELPAIWAPVTASAKETWPAAGPPALPLLPPWGGGETRGEQPGRVPRALTEAGAREGYREKERWGNGQRRYSRPKDGTHLARGGEGSGRGERLRARARPEGEGGAGARRRQGLAGLMCTANPSWTRCGTPADAGDSTADGHVAWRLWPLNGSSAGAQRTPTKRGGGGWDEKREAVEGGVDRSRRRHQAGSPHGLLDAAITAHDTVGSRDGSAMLPLEGVQINDVGAPSYRGIRVPQLRERVHIKLLQRSGVRCTADTEPLFLCVETRLPAGQRTKRG